MPSDALSNDAAECNRLFDALPVAMVRATSLLRQRSVYDREYVEADAEVAKILARVNELLNSTPAAEGSLI
jgi:hypothetical protein